MAINGKRALRIAFFAPLVLLLAACGGRGSGKATQSSGDNLYRPPPVAATPTSKPAATSESSPQGLHPTTTPACTNNLTFQEDLSIPDGTIVAPGEQIDKRWQVENSGTCNWDEKYHLKLIAGPDLGAPAEQALYPARSGTSMVIRMLFTAPAEPGTYRSAWQAYNPQGQPFGDPFFIEIAVAAPTQAP